ncbi:MAG: NAD(P)-dependent oxidoreductase [Hyphomicrobiales bacterium]|nr:NAD(P)-dependent oxidoreductase [Hyphomicrobiales bacterium]
MTRSIAFVGLGAMGFAMATGLVKRQYRVAGYDVRPEARSRFEAAGGRCASTAAEACNGAEALVVMTVNADQAEQVLFDAGACAALPEGASVIVMATCAPARIAAIAERVISAGRRFVDAPVSGGVVGAEAATLTIMAAADPETFRTNETLLRDMGSRLYHLGTRPGQGAAMKVVNQLLCGLHIAVAAEGLSLAEKEGIAPAIALEILSGSAAASWMLKDRGPRMIGADDRVTSAVDIFVKDLGLVLDAGRASKTGLPLAAVAHQLFLAASGMGLGDRDDSQVIEVYRAMQGRKT